MDTMNKVYKVVLQSSHGVKATDIKKTLSIHKTTVHRALFSLEQTGKVESKSGVWFARTENETDKPLEKEIVIELPLPKDQAVSIGLLEILANDLEEAKFVKTARMHRILLERLKETRTIRIKGKNVDDLDLEKMRQLLLQARNESRKTNFSSLVKRLKRTHDDLTKLSNNANPQTISSET